MIRNLRVALAVSLFLLAGQALAEQPNYHVVKKIELGGNGGWDYLNFDSEGNRLYIARADRVMVIDPDEGKLVGEVPNTPGIHGVALAQKLNRGFTSNGREGTVTIFDLKTLKEIDRVKVGSGPDAIIYDPATNRVFTFNARSKDSTAIDAASGKVAGTIKLDGKPEFAVADGKGGVFVNLEDKNEVLSLDANQLTVKEHWPIAPGEEPSGLAMDRDHRRLFVTCGNQKMVILDADSGKVVTTVDIGKGTDAAAFDPEIGCAFSSNRDGTLTVVQEDGPDKFHVVGNVPTQQGARTMALDTKTHNIYLCTAKFKPAPAGERRRPQMEPGTFVVIVVGK